MRLRAILWVCSAFACSIALIGADSSPFPAPTVVVYPLTGTAGTPAEAGGNVAILLSTKLTELGGITVRPYIPGTLRAQYLTAALAQNDDYYITGYLTPVGEEVSLIVQVVSTQSGSVIYSSSATVQTYADVVAQADPLHDAILHHAGRGLPSVGQVATATTPAPITSGGSVNLTRALGRHTRATPTPSPSPSATAVAAVPSISPSPAPSATPKSAARRRIASRAAPVPTATPAATATPAPVVTALPKTTPAPTATPANIARGTHGAAMANGLVVDVDGDASPDERAQAQIALAQAMGKAGLRGEILHVSTSDAKRNSGALCAANANVAAFFLGTLTNGVGTIELSVTVQGCNGTSAAQTQSSQKTSGKGGVTAAIDRAAAADAAALSAAVASISVSKP
jgi:hypothetical protein